MAVPEQVRRQSAAVAEHYRQAGDAASSESDVPDQTDTASEAAPPSEPTTEQSRPEPTQDEGTEQRYRTLQGMYNADARRWEAEKQALHGRLQQLETLLAQMTRPSTQPAAPVAASFVTDEDRSNYGESIPVMRRVAQEEAAVIQQRLRTIEEQFQQLHTNMVPRVEQVVRTQAQSREQSFWEGLSRAVPDWQSINQDNQFHAWLLEVDPLTNATRQALLEHAQRDLDYSRVAAFFAAWKGRNGQETAQPARNASASQLAKQVVPGRGRSGGAPQTPSQTKTYTPTDIAKFYDDVRRGFFKGRDAERAAAERDIFAAQQEGRIVAAR